jgi:hypothetical protein
VTDLTSSWNGTELIGLDRARGELHAMCWADEGVLANSASLRIQACNRTALNFNGDDIDVCFLVLIYSVMIIRHGQEKNNHSTMITLQYSVSHWG